MPRAFKIGVIATFLANINSDSIILREEPT
jgi:hypothetical protein